MKKTTLLLFIMASLAMAGKALARDIYGLHLFFNEKEFIDVVTLDRDAKGNLIGDMHVPDDFDGPLQNIKLEGENLSFDLVVPKNASRPQELIFHYSGKFFDASHEQLIGYVTLKNQKDFIASFTAFKRQNATAKP